MSRYINDYNNFDFLKKLHELKELANKRIVNYEEDSQEHSELTRLIKVVSYLE